MAPREAIAGAYTTADSAVSYLHHASSDRIDHTVVCCMTLVRLQPTSMKTVILPVQTGCGLNIDAELNRILLF